MVVPIQNNQPAARTRASARGPKMRPGPGGPAAAQDHDLGIETPRQWARNLPGPDPENSLVPGSFYIQKKFGCHRGLSGASNHTSRFLRSRHALSYAPGAYIPDRIIKISHAEAHDFLTPRAYSRAVPPSIPNSRAPRHLPITTIAPGGDYPRDLPPPVLLRDEDSEY